MGPALASQCSLQIANHPSLDTEAMRYRERGYGIDDPAECTGAYANQIAHACHSHSVAIQRACWCLQAHALKQTYHLSMGTNVWEYATRYATAKQTHNFSKIAYYRLE